MLIGSEWMCSLLRAGGLSDRVVGLAMDLVALHVGAISYEDSIEAGTPADWERFAAELRDYFAGLPVERFPNLRELAPWLTAAEDRFRFGVDVILAGLEAVDRGRRT